MLGDPDMMMHDSEAILGKTKDDFESSTTSPPKHEETQHLSLKLSVSDDELSDVGETNNKNDSVLDNDSDSDDDIVIRTKIKKAPKAIDLDSDEEDDGDNKDETKQKRPVLESSDSEDSVKDEGYGNSNDNTEKSVNLSLNNDLYDDEGGEDDGNNDNRSRHSSSSGSDEDEEDGDTEMSEEMKKKLKKMKGASKTAKRNSSTRKSKTAAEQEIRELHSESQRLTRESRVSLPYHQPKPMDLKELLAKKRTKVSDAVTLRAPIHKVLAKTGVAASPYISRKFRHSKDKPTSPKNENQDSSQQQTVASDNTSQETDKDNKETDKSSNVIDNGNKETDSTLASDDLPDLVAVVPSEQLEHSPSKEENVDYNLAPANTVVETEGSDNDSAEKMEIEENNAATTSSELNTSRDISDVANNAEIIPCAQTTESDEVEEVVEQKSSKKSILADMVLPKLKPFGPTISGSGESFIDLDADVDRHSGISALMSRAMKHAKTKGAEKKKEVEMSVVCKETDESQKEQLTLKKFTVTIEGEEVVDPALQKPDVRLQRTNLGQGHIIFHLDFTKWIFKIYSDLLLGSVYMISKTFV